VNVTCAARSSRTNGAKPEEELKAFEVSALDYILKPFSDKRYERSLVLRDGTELKLSRSYRQKVEASLGQSL
jgi:two-component SAPR family response regulator